MNLAELEETVRIYSRQLEDANRDQEIVRLEAIELYNASRPTLRQRLGSLLIAVGLKLDPDALPVDHAAVEQSIALAQVRLS